MKNSKEIKNLRVLSMGINIVYDAPYQPEVFVDQLTLLSDARQREIFDIIEPLVRELQSEVSAAKHANSVKWHQRELQKLLDETD